MLCPIAGCGKPLHYGAPMLGNYIAVNCPAGHQFIADKPKEAA